MEFFETLVSNIGPAVARVSAPKNHMSQFQTTARNVGTRFQAMNFGIQKGIILLFWIIITGGELEWSQWNSSGPMKLQRIYGATTIVDLFSILILIISAAAADLNDSLTMALRSPSRLAHSPSSRLQTRSQAVSDL
jgi:hypothetical protein